MPDTTPIIFARAGSEESPEYGAFTLYVVSPRTGRKLIAPMLGCHDAIGEPTRLKIASARGAAVGFTPDELRRFLNWATRCDVERRQRVAFGAAFVSTSRGTGW